MIWKHLGAFVLAVGLGSLLGAGICHYRHRAPQVVTQAPECKECECKSGGWCCCGGKCKPKCDCGPGCKCEKPELIVKHRGPHPAPRPIPRPYYPYPYPYYPSPYYPYPYFPRPYPYYGVQAAGVTDVDTDGLKAAIKKFEGKTVLVEVWGTWCGPCRRQTPKTIALSVKYRVPLLMISVGEQSSAAPQKFLTDHFFAWTNTAVNFTGTLSDLKPLVDYPGYVPHMLIIDAKGKHYEFSEATLKALCPPTRTN